MPKNRIRELRTSRGLTQRQLAEIVGTSQQQIQRMEAGIQAARLEIAARICGALNEQMAQVFPATKKVLTQLARSKQRFEDLTSDEKKISEMEEAGIDMDPEVWTLKLRLRGRTRAELGISGIEQKRLWRVLQEHDDSFVVFDAMSKRVAINPKHLLSWQFLFDPPNLISADVERDEESVSIYLSDSSKPLHFEVDADCEEFGDEENDGRPTQLQGLLHDLETVGGDEDTIVSFDDVDGERVFFRAAEVSMMQLPLWAVEPSLEQEEEDEGENTAADQNATTSIQ